MFKLLFQLAGKSGGILPDGVHLRLDQLLVILFQDVLQRLDQLFRTVVLLGFVLTGRVVLPRIIPEEVGVAELFKACPRGDGHAEIHGAEHHIVVVFVQAAVIGQRDVTGNAVSALCKAQGVADPNLVVFREHSVNGDFIRGSGHVPFHQADGVDRFPFRIDPHGFDGVGVKIHQRFVLVTQVVKRESAGLFDLSKELLRRSRGKGDVPVFDVVFFKALVIGGGNAVVRHEKARDHADKQHEEQEDGNKAERVAFQFAPESFVHRIFHLFHHHSSSAAGVFCSFT